MGEHERSSHDAGFTLVELLVVIVILGILTSVVVFSVGNATSNANLSACRTNVATVRTAMEAYKAANGRYPADPQAALVPTYLSAWPEGDGYDVTASVRGGQLRVTSTLADCPDQP